MNHQQITLETLRLSFGVDITPAEGLHGQELTEWIERVEDEVFEREHAELRAQHLKLTSEEPQIAWEEIGWNMDLHGITETKSCVLVCDGIFYAAIMSSVRGGDESITPFGPDRRSLGEAMQDVNAGPAAFGHAVSD